MIRLQNFVAQIWSCVLYKSAYYKQMITTGSITCGESLVYRKWYQWLLQISNDKYDSKHSVTQRTRIWQHVILKKRLNKTVKNLFSTLSVWYIKYVLFHGISAEGGYLMSMPSL